ncbi:DnaB-like helicase C-terminal domain-containing protein [Nocardiopsis sp. NPDC006139]|uniref:replicative DNA helicase n=1 Tax=Nocardiopsis sp. NPDC006139 TaxID=3154578 RepID=UPI0033AF8F7A
MTVHDITPRIPHDPDTPPHDIGAEQIMLGAAMLDSRALRDLTDIAGPMDLYRPAHQIILETIMGMADLGLPVEPVAVHRELAKRKKDAVTGGALYLTELTGKVPTVASATHYAKIVADLAFQRRLIAAGERIAQIGWQGEGDPIELGEVASEALRGALSAGVTGEPDTELLGDDAAYMDALEKPLSTENMVPAPYADLAEKIGGGFLPGQLICVAGRTGGGKSTMGIDIGRVAAIRHKMPTLYITLEMPADQVRNRIYSAEAKVASSRFTEHSLTEGDWERVAKVRPAVNAAPMWIAKPAKCTLTMIRQRLQAMGRRGYPPRLLVVDHVGLMSSTGKTESRYTEVSDYARGLKLIALEFDIVVVMLCQVNRAVGGRADAIPRVSDLRDSGELEQSSDMVVMVHRPDYELSDKIDGHERAGEVDLYIVKHRNGPTAVVTVASQLHYSRFADLAQA